MNYAASHARPAGEAVEPGNRVARLLMRFEQLEALVESGGGLRAGDHHGTRDRDELQLGFENDSGQAHAAAGGPEQFRVVGRAAAHDFAVGQHQGQFTHMLTETAVPVMVLAMDVRRDRTADTDHGGARQNRQEPASGHDFPQDFAQAQTGGALQDPGGGIEFADMA